MCVCPSPPASSPRQLSFFPRPPRLPVWDPGGHWSSHTCLRLALHSNCPAFVVDGAFQHSPCGLCHGAPLLPQHLQSTSAAWWWCQSSVPWGAAPSFVHSHCCWLTVAFGRAAPCAEGSLVWEGCGSSGAQPKHALCFGVVIPLLPLWLQQLSNESCV
jgi:hypothetical protein